MRKNIDYIEIKKSKIHRYIDNYYFFLQTIQDQYNSFVKKIYSQNELNSNTKEFTKEDSKLSSFFIVKYEKILLKCKFIEICISNIANKSAALDAALSAFASINATGQSLTSWEVIYSKIFSKLNDEKVSERFEKEFKSFVSNQHIDTLSRGKFLTKKLSADEIMKFFFAKHFKVYDRSRLVTLYDKYLKEHSDSCEDVCNSLLNFMREVQGIDNGEMKDGEDWKYSSALNSLGMHARDNKTLISIILHITNLGLNFTEKVEIFSQLHYYLLRYSIINGSKAYVGIFEKLLSVTKKNELLSLIADELKSNDLEIKVKIKDLHNNFFSGNLKSITKDLLLLNESKERMGAVVSGVDYNLLQPKYTIEHILPQSYQKASKTTQQHFDRLKHSLSNLTLLTKSDNSKASDKSFSGKMYYFLVGVLQINDKLVKEIKTQYNINKPPNEKIDTIKRVIGTKSKYELEIKNKNGDDITSNLNASFIKENWLFGSIDHDYENIIKASKYLEDKIELLFDYDKFKSYHDFIDTDDQFKTHRKPLWDVETEIEEFNYKAVE